MATWKRVSAEPITVEREVSVYREDTSEEGYVGVRWDHQSGGGPQLYGPVVSLERFFDEGGSEIAEPKKTVLDRDPTFA